MSWSTHVADYCEQGVSTSLWSQPLNASSNAVFLVAAAVVRHRLRGRGPVPLSVSFPVPVAAAVGVGSLAFHTLSTAGARVADQVPIEVFVLWFLASYLRWFHGLPWRACVAGAVVFAVLTQAFAVVAGDVVPNGSAPYVPVLAVLVAMAVVLRRSRDPQRRAHARAFTVAAAAFTGGLVARTADRAACGAVPFGTHWLWHLLDGCVVLLTSLALVRRWQEVEEDRP